MIASGIPASAIEEDRVTDTNFATLADPYRSELLAHCYRMLGSVHDAEDAVQETYVRAWRGYDRFEGRTSLRRWLYTIATRACLRALENAARRPLPSGLGAPSDDHRVEMPGALDIAWLQPIPDILLGDSNGITADPASIVAARAGIRLAFIAALQHLPARQRAVLILCDVLTWPAAEVAGALDTTTAAVNSALQRARAHLQGLGLREDEITEPDDVEIRSLLDSYARAMEHADIGGLVDLVRADVELEMPPQPLWFTGRDATLGFLATRVLRRPGAWRMVPTRANGQPALAAYELGTDGVYRPHGLHVLTLIGGRVARITAFNDASLVAAAGMTQSARRSPPSDGQHDG
jgi:RNA polymerase sigma-70 factor (TIGR02960 family)